MASFYNGYNMYLQNNNNYNQNINNNTYGTKVNPYDPKNNYEKKEEFSYTLRKNNTYNNNNNNDPFKQNSYNIIQNNYNNNRVYPANNANYTAKNIQNNQRRDHVAEIFNYNSNNNNNNSNNAYYNNVYNFNPKTYRNQSSSPQKQDINNNNNNNLNSTLTGINKNNNNNYNNNNSYTQRSYSLNNNQYNPLYNNNNINNNYYNQNIKPPIYDNNIYNNNNNTEQTSQNLPEYSNKNCSAVREYSYKEEPNSRFRSYMEDKGVVVENVNNISHNILFCLFDGHGGGEVSNFLQKNFPNYFKEFLIKSSNNISPNLFTSLFPYIDDKIKTSNFNQMGSTACTVFITKENSNRVLYSANIGDTRCIIISKNGAVKRLSYDHRASEKDEQNRIIESGGIVFAGRVYGQLMLSRAFGDWELKNYGVSNIPYVSKTDIDDISNSWKWVVIASDGIWDVLNDKDLYNFNCNVSNSKDFCDLIIQESLKRGSTDNLSCFVIKV
jgi:serine/threonine protein phosphatase PrpC